MIIEFKSKIIQNGQKNLIEFKAPVHIYENGLFHVFEFADPQSHTMNMIEVSDQAINIFAGSMTINLKLHKKIKIDYAAPQGNIYFISYLKNIDQHEKTINFSYTLSSQQDELLGEYNITLKTFKEIN